MSFRRFFNPRQDFTSPRYVDLEFMTRGVFIPIDDFDYDDNYFRDQRREPHFNMQHYGPPDYEQYDNESYDQYSRDDEFLSSMNEISFQLEIQLVQTRHLMSNVLFEIAELRSLTTRLDRLLREEKKPGNNTRKMEPRNNFYECIFQFGCSFMASMVSFWILN